MDPSERLRQLREQRQLVARHLAWLEDQIAAEASPSDTPAAASPSAAPEAASPEPGAASPEPAATPAPPAQAAPGATDPVVAMDLPAPAEAGFDRRQRIGCIVAGIVGAAVLLFLLWGLPQLLY